MRSSPGRAPNAPSTRPRSYDRAASGVNARHSRGLSRRTGRIYNSEIPRTAVGCVSHSSSGCCDTRSFTPKDFLDPGGRDAVDQALSRLVRSGDLRRLGRGLYDYPRMNPRLGIPVAPDTDEVADAIGRKTGSRLVPSGVMAANRLGLSTQVPAKPVYLSDGRARRVKVGTLELQIRHVGPKELPVGRRSSAMVLQALRHLGPDAVDDRVIAKVRHALSPRQRRDLMEDARYTTGWIASAVRRIACDDRKKAGVARG